MLCSRVFRSSVLNNVPLTEQGKEDGIRAVARLTRRSSSGWLGDGPSGRGQFAQVILTGWVLTLAQAALAALGQVRA